MGAIGALAVMTVLSAGIGYALPNLLPRLYTHYAAILLVRRRMLPPFIAFGNVFPAPGVWFAPSCPSSLRISVTNS